VKTKNDLRQLLLSVNHRGYPAYKDTRGKWDFGKFVLSIDHVQGDPFASPSKLSAIIPGHTAGFPEYYYQCDHRRAALQDLLLRLFGKELGDIGGKAGSGKSGLVSTTRCGQEILERSACRIDAASGDIVIRFEVGFPANGRTINSPELIRILIDYLPEAVIKSLVFDNLDKHRVRNSVFLADDQHYIRTRLPETGLCAFIADGSVLPRESGISQRPMKDAVVFYSPESMAVEMNLPHLGPIRGMGIRKGITLIVGGGYHGKSTLLQALERGVYDHISGDGREYVITDPSAVKVRAEDGRSIVSTDISLFINDLPNKKDTADFTTPDASGSTSQAANVVEAMEAGSSLLLIDEDTSATNFMVRDQLMQMVVSPEKEPITPFISRIRELYEKEGVSTILVAGSSGSYFYVSDSVIQMDHYIPYDITGTVRDIISTADVRGAWNRDQASFSDIRVNYNRVVIPDRGLKNDNRIKIKTLSADSFLLNHDEVILRGMEQIADREQTAALAYIIKYMELHIFNGRKTLQQAVDEMEDLIKCRNIDVLFDGGCPGTGLALPRRQEIFGALNRFRKLQVNMIIA